MHLCLFVVMVLVWSGGRAQSLKGMTGVSFFFSPPLPHPPLSFGLQFAHLPVQLALLRQFLVELAQLAQEAVVGADFPLVPHGGHRQPGVHFVAQHEVGHDHGGRAAVAFSAVHVDLPCRGTGAEQLHMLVSFRITGGIMKEVQLQRGLIRKSVKNVLT